MRFSLHVIAALLILGVLILISPRRSLPRNLDIAVVEERKPAAPVQGSESIQSNAVKPGPIRKAAPNGSYGGQLAEDLRRNSRGEWQMSWSQGALVRLSGAHLPLREASPDLAAQTFLRQYGGMISASSGELDFDTRRQIGGNIQLIYSQKENSLPIFGTRVNMIFDSAQNLIYLSSNAYSGPSVPLAPVFSVERAAAEAQVSLRDFRVSHGDSGEPVSEMLLRRNCVLGYRLADGAISLVYKFSISIPNSPIGDVEILVDDASGAVLLVRSISRK